MQPFNNKKPRQEKQDCMIEVKRTKTGRKVVIGKNCTKEQVQMARDHMDND